jgi:hypothetical protein
MPSVVSEAASEGMLFSAICAPSRFHTAKTTAKTPPDIDLQAQTSYTEITLGAKLCSPPLSRDPR